MIPQPLLRPIPARAEYRLVRDYEVISDGYRIVVPRCFSCDLASIPAIGWHATYTPHHPLVAAAALVHDWLYFSHQVTRQEADLIFLDLLLRNGADSTKSWIMFKAVVVAGGGAWKRCKHSQDKAWNLYRILRRVGRFEEYGFPVGLLGDNAKH